MASVTVFVLCSVLLFAPAAHADGVSPMDKVFKMLDELRSKIVQEGEANAKTYKKLFDWCDDEASELRNEISDRSSKKADLESTITSKTSERDAAVTEIEDLAESISKDEAELKEATAVRDKESAEFAASEADLEATIDTLSRAIGVIEKQGAALVQMDSSKKNLVSTLRAIIDAAAFRTADKERLAALVQAKEGADDNSAGAPAGAAYENKSGGIVDLLEELKEEAEEQLSNVRKAETVAAHNYAKTKQALTDSVMADTKASDETKAAMAAAKETVANAQGELEKTAAALDKVAEALKLAHSDCIQAAADHEKSVTSRTEELSVLAQAEKILKEATGGALVQQSVSLLQVAAGTSQARLEVLRIVKDLAQRHRSPALTQLVSRITAVVRFSAKSGADPFAKIKNLIEGLIAKLRNEAAEDAEGHAWCDEQMSKTAMKKDELAEDVDRLSTKIDKGTSKSVSLKEQANTLHAELAQLVKSQGEMDEIRSQEHEDYLESKATLEAGVKGVRNALQVLRDYYGSSAALVQQAQPTPPANHEQSGEAGGSIISILEVCESDFASGLSKVEMEEADAQAEFDSMTQENKMTQMAKEQDVKYTTEAATKKDKAVSDIEADLRTEKDEQTAVLKYWAEIRAKCVAQPDPYEVQKARRDSQIKGLKEALNVLENEVALIQRKQVRSHNLRK